MTEGLPSRDDIVANWIKQHRDKWAKYSTEWFALDDLLDDYKFHADTGVPLNVSVYNYRSRREESK